MKVGFSLGRCIRDIATNLVDINDVVVIVAGTRIKDRQTLQMCIEQYMQRQDYLLGLDLNTCLEVALELWESGRIHQPRVLGNYRTQVAENCVWADLYPTVHGNEMVDNAWKEYRTMINLLFAGAAGDLNKQKNNWVQRQ